MNDQRKKQRKGVGCGIFLILVGVGIFAERMNWFPFNMVWFLPAAFVAWGIAVLVDVFRGK